MAKKYDGKVAVVDGEKLEITGENGRYWLCGETQVRKARASVENAKTEKKCQENRPLDKEEEA